YVLHDIFDLPFDQIAPIVDRSEAAARQLASRARRRVQGRQPAPDSADRQRRMDAVTAFLAAARGGDFDRLVALLHPDAVLRADAAAIQLAAANKGRAPVLQRELRGARAVAETLKGRAQAAEPAFVDGEPGAIWVPGGTLRAVFVFTIEG